MNSSSDTRRLLPECKITKFSLWRDIPPTEYAARYPPKEQTVQA